MTKLLLGLLALLPGVLSEDYAGLPADLLMEDDVCTTDSDGEACALQLRALRGEAVQATIQIHDHDLAIDGDEKSEPNEEAESSFEEADADEDGEVQEGELRNFLEKKGKATDAFNFASHSAALLAVHDVDQSKTLNLAEFGKAMETVDWGRFGRRRGRRPRWGGRHHRHWLLQQLKSPHANVPSASEAALFQMADIDKSGALDEPEVRSLLQQTMGSTAAGQTASLMEVYDLDQSGSLKADEFSQALDTVTWWGAPPPSPYNPYHHPYDPYNPYHHPYNPYNPYAHPYNPYHHWLMQINETKAAEAFQSVDKDSNGVVDESELQEFMTTGEEDQTPSAAALLEAHDKDQSKSLNLAEFSKAMEAWYPNPYNPYYHPYNPYNPYAHPYNPYNPYAHPYNPYNPYHHWLMQLNQTSSTSLVARHGTMEAAELIKTLDEDTDGEVNEQELAAFLQRAGAPESFPAASLLELHDADQSKTLNKDEVRQALEKAGWAPPSSPSASESAPVQQNEDALFAAMDTDGDGSVNEKELSAFLQSAEVPDSFPSAASLIEEHDQDQSKTLNKGEVRQALKKAGFWPPPPNPYGPPIYGPNPYGPYPPPYNPYHPFHPFAPAFHPLHPFHPYYLLQQEGEGDSEQAVLFAATDKDGDGEVQAGEMHSFLQQVKSPKSHLDRALVNLFDEDDSKGLNLEEFDRALDTADWWEHSPIRSFRPQSALTQYLVNMGATKEAESAIDDEEARIFKAVDSNKDGEIDSQELHSFLDKTTKASKERQASLLEVHDMDSSNSLNRKEFSKALDTVSWSGYGGPSGGSGYGYTSAYGHPPSSGFGGGGGGNSWGQSSGYNGGSSWGHNQGYNGGSSWGHNQGQPGYGHSGYGYGQVNQGYGSSYGSGSSWGNNNHGSGYGASWGR